MAEQAAHLVDHVLPHVPVRQWVLTLPHRLRYLLAYNHALCRAVLGVAVRAVLGFYRRRARHTGVRDGRSGAVTVIQRFGGGLQLNVHFPTLLLDGVFAEGEDGSLDFHAAEPPSDEEVARLLATIYRRVQRLLARRGLDVDDPPDVDPLAEESPALAGISSASIQGRIALGPRAGARVYQLGREPEAPWVTSRGPCQAHLEGFDLHASITVGADDRAGVERLCRYVLPPPVAQEPLAPTPDRPRREAGRHEGGESSREAPRLEVGGLDAAGFRSRRSGMPPLRRPHVRHRHDRGGRRPAQNPGPPRPSDRPARASAGPPPSLAARPLPRHPGLTRRLARPRPGCAPTPTTPASRGRPPSPPAEDFLAHRFARLVSGA